MAENGAASSGGGAPVIKAVSNFAVAGAVVTPRPSWPTASQSPLRVGCGPMMDGYRKIKKEDLEMLKKPFSNCNLT